MRMTLWEPFRNWDPFRDVARLQRVVEPFLTGNRVAYPPLEIIDKDDEAIVIAEVPGIDKNSIELTVLGETLAIAGEKKLPTEENVTYIRHERPHGKFRRQIELPYAVEQDKVSANYKDGILTIVLPKAEEVKPRQITVE